jgi:hypothetical protein
VSTGRLRVGIGSIGLREVREVEAPEASESNFTGVTLPQDSPSNFGGGAQNWVLVAEVDKMAHRVGYFLGFLSQYRLLFLFPYLEVAATLATIILQAFFRQGLSHVRRLRTASCQQSI